MYYVYMRVFLNDSGMIHIQDKVDLVDYIRSNIVSTLLAPVYRSLTVPVINSGS